MNKVNGFLTINKGEDLTKVIKFRTSEFFNIVDIASASEIGIIFPKTSGTLEIKKTDVGTPVAMFVGTGATNGDIQFTLTTAQTIDLKKGNDQDVTVYWVVAGKKTIHVLKSVLNVL